MDSCDPLFLPLAVAGPSDGVPPPPGLTMADHYAVTKHLRQLSNLDLIGVGGALGLYYPHLRKMNPLLEELVAAWLNREDNVSGDPSWASLIKALRDINQPGIAQKIEEGMVLEARLLRAIGCSIVTVIVSILTLISHCDILI